MWASTILASQRCLPCKPIPGESPTQSVGVSWVDLIVRTAQIPVPILGGYTMSVYSSVSTRPPNHTSNWTVTCIGILASIFQTLDVSRAACGRNHPKLYHMTGGQPHSSWVLTTNILTPQRPLACEDGFDQTPECSNLQQTSVT